MIIDERMHYYDQGSILIEHFPEFYYCPRLFRKPAPCMDLFGRGT